MVIHRSLLPIIHSQRQSSAPRSPSYICQPKQFSLIHNQEMRRGFNKYSQNQQEDSRSENPSEQGRSLTNLAFPFAALSNTGLSGSSSVSESVMLTLFQVVEQQSQALQALVGKVDSITQKTLELTDRIRDLKRTRTEERPQERPEERRSGGKGETLKGRGDVLEPSTLIRILFGEEKRYQYRLKLAHKLELPLYRERNFFLDIELTDLNGNPVRNSNKIPLSLALYSSQNPPKFIEKNTAGQKILKGYVEQSLHQGVCKFQKIQIKEVTSHFRNGWVFIVIIPSMTPLGSVVPDQQAVVDYTKVEPLVLDRVIVKAKKLKQRKEGNRGDNEHEQEQEHEEEGQGEEEGKIAAEEQIYSDQK